MNELRTRSRGFRTRVMAVIEAFKLNLPTE
jgi:hypothetical protein